MRKPCIVWQPLALTSILAVAAWLGVSAADNPVEIVREHELTSRLAKAGSAASLVVQIGWAEGQPAWALGAEGKCIVHVLEPDPRTVETARQKLKASNLSGVIAVQWWPEAWLPLPEHSINLIVCHRPKGMEEAELIRVTAPLGEYWLRQEEGWKIVRKPWPSGMDAWTHGRHDADGNMVSHDALIQPPTGVRWIAGPAQDDAGKKYYYDHVLLTAHGRNYYVYDHEIVARDAFNGRLLWQRKTKAHTIQEAGSPVFLKTGMRVSKVRPVAQGDRLYVAMEGKLCALEGATGEVVQHFTEVDSPREILITGQRILLLSDANGIRAFATSGEKMWEIPQVPKRMVATGDRLFYLCGNQLTCANAATGAIRWRTSHELADQAATMTCGQGVVVLERSSWKDDAPGNGLLVFDAESGACLWEKVYTPGMTHYKEARAFLVEGLIWIQAERQVIAGFDPQSGKEIKRLPSRGLHCATPVATSQYFIAPEMEFTHFKTGERARARMVKSACRLPFVPANGLLYTFPVQCECFPMLRGYLALAQTPPYRSAESLSRLQRGPAYGVHNQIQKSEADNDWPMYRKDIFRSNFQPHVTPGTAPRLAWQTQIASLPSVPVAGEWEDNPFTAGWLTAPVCAQGLVLVAAPDQHEVQALDAASGKRMWSFMAGGRVDGPPSVADGWAVFGCHDGYVYCLRLADGQLAWRLRIAPQEQLHPAYAQLESLWPVVGSPLVENGVAYVAAGRHPDSDGGVKVAAIQLKDGVILWEQTVTDMGIKQWYGGALPGSSQKVGVDYEPVDMLVRDGGRVAMSRWQFQPLNGQCHVAVSLTNYIAFGKLAVPRGLWGYGIRQTKQVQPKLAAAFSPERVVYGSSSDVAVVLAGNVAITADGDGQVRIGPVVVPLKTPIVRDGLAVAQGRLYVSGAQGSLYCIALE